MSEIPLTWEQNVLLLIKKVIHKDVAKLIVYKSSILYEHKNKINFIMKLHQYVKPCDLCYRICYFDRNMYLPKKSKTKYASRWICIKSDTHDKWFEIICDNCFKNSVVDHPIHEGVKIIYAGKDRKSLRLKIL